MIVTQRDKKIFYEELYSIIDQMGSDVVVRTKAQEDTFRDFFVRSVSYNQSTTTSRTINETFQMPGNNFEAGYVYIVSYHDLRIIPKSGDLVLIPSYSANGIKKPLKIQDSFTIGEVVPIVIENMLLFLYLNCSRTEINPWSE